MSWDTVTLDDVCTLVNGRAYRQAELLDSGTPVIRIQNLNGGHRWYYSDLELQSNKYCNNGDLLYAWSGSFGPYIWRGEKCIYHYHIWKVIPKSNVNKNYLFYLLDFITYKIKDTGHGIALIHVTKEGMENFSIPLPPLETQKRIVELLDRAQTLIDKRKEQIGLLDQLIQSLFSGMFGDLVTNPMGWDEKKFNVFFDIKTGKLDSNAMVKGGAYPFFTCAKEAYSIDSYAFDQEALLLSGNNAAGK